jgi:predicted  nucleic acid-binding Zn-ribbon protein
MDKVDCEKCHVPTECLNIYPPGKVDSVPLCADCIAQDFETAMQERDALRAQVRRLRQAAIQAKDAFHFTREYAGEKMLPALPGWSWYDATLALEAALAATEARFGG